MQLKDPADYRLPSRSPYRLIFLTVSGSHAYGFESEDSDYDLRGAHIAPLREVLALPAYMKAQETVEISEPKGPGSEEMVTHEIGKFLDLMVRKGGSLVEHILSPLVVATSPLHASLARLAPNVVSRRHVKHYFGFAQSQIAMTRRRPDKEVKVLLYIFRTLLSGLVLAQDGEVIVNLPELLERAAPPSMVAFVTRLIEAKRCGVEESALPTGMNGDTAWAMIAMLEDKLREGLAKTTLPDETPREVLEAVNTALFYERMTRCA